MQQIKLNWHTYVLYLSAITINTIMKYSNSVPIIISFDMQFNIKV